MHKKTLIILLVFTFLISCHSTKNNKLFDDRSSNIKYTKKSIVNTKRAISIIDSTFTQFFDKKGMVMARFYNPFTECKSLETGSVWMYTSAIESVNSILKILQTYKENGKAEIYEENYSRYIKILYSLYDNLDYYKGTFELTSYTQTRPWSVYGVHRSYKKGMGKVEGIENVYDDQMWLIRELLQSFKITKDDIFLDEAEYLSSYVLDGWDCSIDENGVELGGITWGPGYVTKHACSNGPLISPLVWLHEYYVDSNEYIEYKYIDVNDGYSRVTDMIKKSDYYLMFARKIYDWQKNNLLREDGVYADMMGGCSPECPEMIKVINTLYRNGSRCADRVGRAYTYNSGSMISGASDLFKVTSDSCYYKDAKELVLDSFRYFAEYENEVPKHYSYDFDGFSNWFNGVLLRSYLDFYSCKNEGLEYITSFQNNLDLSYDNFAFKGFLPPNLLGGWEHDIESNNIEGMFMFSFASMYANLALVHIL